MTGPSEAFILVPTLRVGMLFRRSASSEVSGDGRGAAEPSPRGAWERGPGAADD